MEPGIALIEEIIRIARAEREKLSADPSVYVARIMKEGEQTMLHFLERNHCASLYGMKLQEPVLAGHMELWLVLEDGQIMVLEAKI